MGLVGTGRGPAQCALPVISGALMASGPSRLALARKRISSECRLNRPATACRRAAGSDRIAYKMAVF